MTESRNRLTGGVCKQHLQTAGNCLVAWYIDTKDEYIHVDFGIWPDSASLVLPLDDAQRLHAALGQALLDLVTHKSPRAVPVFTVPDDDDQVDLAEAEG